MKHHSRTTNQQPTIRLLRERAVLARRARAIALVVQLPSAERMRLAERIITQLERQGDGATTAEVTELR